MPLRSDFRRWGSVSMFLHWIMAAGILGVGALGLWMDGMKPSMAKINMFALHKSIGLTLLALLLLRVLWRAIDRGPREMPAPRWQQWAARGVHAILYVLIAALPLSGWLFNSLRGYPLQWFKLFNLPPLAGKDMAWAPFIKDVHEYLFWMLLMVLVVHVGAALKHHWVDHDDVLRRMWPLARQRQESNAEGDRP
jgi:cytochrome b561